MLLDTTSRSDWAASMPVKAIPNDIYKAPVRYSGGSVDLLDIRECNRAQLRRIHRRAGAAAGVERYARYGAAQVHLRCRGSTAHVRDRLEAVAARGRLRAGLGAAVPGE